MCQGLRENVEMAAQKSVPGREQEISGLRFDREFPHTH